jgi:hypothetical protein
MLKTGIALPGADELIKSVRRGLKISLAGGASATAILSLPVANGETLLVEALVQASAGTFQQNKTFVAANTGDTFTLEDHGLIQGQPVMAISGLPTGITANTVYYVIKTDDDVIKLASSAANAAGATAVAISADAAAAVLSTVALIGVYKVTAAVANKNGVTALVGTPDVVAFEDVAGWACTIQANDTTNALEVDGTPDGVLSTTFDVYAQIVRMSNAV